MSDPVTGTGSPLDAVLQRIEALVAQNRTARAPQRAEVPRLTEVYASPQALHFFEAEVMELPLLEHQQPQAAAPVPPQDNALRRQQLLEAMQPVIGAAVQGALRDELGVLEKNLRARLEQEMQAVLKARLEAELP